MPTAPSVSIALATHNGARFLDAQLQSLADQTARPGELVVFEDASTDGTPSILGAFAERAAFPVRLERGAERRGYRAAFMAAAQACTGDLIAFCDQDDVWEPAKLERMTAPFGDPDVLLAHHDATLIDAEGRRLGPPLLTRRRGPWDVVPGFAQLFRRRLLAFAPLQPRSVDPLWAIAAARDPASKAMAHDQFFLFWADALGRAAHVPEALVRYRQHPGALFGRAPNPALFALARAPELAAGKAEAADAQVALLEAARPLCSPAELERLSSLLEARRATLPHLHGRAALYRREGLLGRACSLLKLAAAGAYGRGGLGPGLGDLAVDLAAAPRALASRKARSAGLSQA